MEVRKKGEPPRRVALTFLEQEGTKRMGKSITISVYNVKLKDVFTVVEKALTGAKDQEERG